MVRDLVTRGTLYVVATPLGNLGDVSARACDVLRGVEVVAAEDTRRSRVLLAHIGAAPKRVVSCHAHTSPRTLDRLAASLAAGASIALLTDAGTPGVSDPGVALVNRARGVGAAVVPIPGPSAVSAAVSAAGLPGDRYLFLGFLPRTGAERARLLRSACDSEWTVVLFEAAPRLERLLADLQALAGPSRPAVVARELTKVYEEIRPGTLAELGVYYKERSPKGEVTLVMAGRPAADEVPPTVSRADVEARAREWLAAGLSRRDTAARLASEAGIPRNEAYRMVTEL